ncbi:uncharacterized protein TNCT_123871 [Trichonephila clavata]|uniref:Uncharacterized protein n=1 Tax=Trichonephila clavata TaxID=2740835 RepID=A0A8X6IDW5_TRICU|nr:uncharacterized protein TNCT_123871 [Trichonephila clavata]
MSTLLYSTLVIVVVLCTANFTPVTCEDSGEDLRQKVAFNVSMLSGRQRASQDAFVDAVVEGIYSSKTLSDLFDISYTSPVKFSFHVHKIFVLTSQALGAADFENIAELATRPMAQNFDTFEVEDMVRVYANYPAIYAYSEGILTRNNAEALAGRYIRILEKSARTTVVEGDYTSKFTAITDGFDHFLNSIDRHLSISKMWKLAIYYHHQWLLTGVDLGRKNHLYNECIDDANVNWDEDDSDSGSSESHECESDSDECPWDSDSSESDSSSSESKSSSSESDSSSSGSDSSSS